MAAAVASDVTIIRAWTEGGTAGKAVLCRHVQLPLTSGGAVKADMLATIFGLTYVEQVITPRISTDAVAPNFAPSYDGTGIIAFVVTQATGAVEPANVTGTYRFVVKGY